MTYHAIEPQPNSVETLERPPGFNRYRGGHATIQKSGAQNGPSPYAFRRRLLNGLLRGGEPSKRQLRAIEYVAYAILTHKEGGVRRLLPASTQKDILTQHGIPPDRRTASDVERRYLKIVDSVLAVKSLKELEAENWLEKARAIKYDLGKRYVTQEAIRASVACLLVFERLASIRGFRGSHEPRQQAWNHGRIPIEPPLEQPALLPESRAIVDIWGQVELVTEPVLEGRAGLSEAQKRPAPGSGAQPRQDLEALGAGLDAQPSSMGRARAMSSANNRGQSGQLVTGEVSLAAPVTASPKRAEAEPDTPAARLTTAAAHTPGGATPVRSDIDREAPPVPPWELEALLREQVAARHRVQRSDDKARRRRQTSRAPTAPARATRARSVLIGLTALFMLVALVAVGHILIGASVPVPAVSSHYQIYDVAGTPFSDVIASARRLDGQLLLTANDAWHGLSMKAQHARMGEMGRALLGTGGIESIIVLGKRGRVLAEARGDTISVTRPRTEAHGLMRSKTARR